MVAPTPFFGDRGCHIRIYEEIRALDDNGVRVLLTTYPAGKDIAGVELRRQRFGSFLSREKIGPDAGKFLLDAGLFVSSYREAREFKPDIIHGHLHEGCVIGKLLSVATGRPLVFDYQGSLSGEMSHHGFLSEGSLGFAFFRKLEKFIDGLPNAVFTSSTAMSIRAAGGGRGRWFFIPDAIDTDMFKPMGRDDALAKLLGLPPDKPVCVFLGLLNRYQGADLLIKSISSMKNRYGDVVHFLIMGYPDVDHYEEIAAHSSVRDCVTFTGRVAYEDAPRYLCLGDFAAAPKIATTESNGKVVDYMACGLPTVALDTAVNRELMGDAGYYVKWDGSESRAAQPLADAFVRMAENTDLRGNLGNAGRERVMRRFCREELGRALMDAYGRVLEKRR